MIIWYFLEFYVQELQGISLSICPYTFWLDFQGMKQVTLLEGDGHRYKTLGGNFWCSKKEQIVIFWKSKL